NGLDWERSRLERDTTGCRHCLRECARPRRRGAAVRAGRSRWLQQTSTAPWRPTRRRRYTRHATTGKPPGFTELSGVSGSRTFMSSPRDPRSQAPVFARIPRKRAPNGGGLAPHWRSIVRQKRRRIKIPDTNVDGRLERPGRRDPTHAPRITKARRQDGRRAGGRPERSPLVDLSEFQYDGFAPEPPGV